MLPPTPRRNNGINAARVATAIEQRANMVAVTGEKPGEHSHKLHQYGALADLFRTEIHRRADIKQEPGRNFAVFVVLAYIR